jgi:pimeloyl-ACP methyl ester carboxylesterase
VHLKLIKMTVIGRIDLGAGTVSRRHASGPIRRRGCQRHLQAGPRRRGQKTAPSDLAGHDIGSNTRMARFMQAQIRGLTLQVLPALKHNLLVEAPEQIAALTADFLHRQSVGE